jgi:ornithine decarboxylase
MRAGPMEVCSVFGPTCDALDVVSVSENLPSDLELGELLFSRNVGAYTTASATGFNGMPAARVISVNR